MLFDLFKSKKYESLPPAAFKEKLANEKTAIILDVRTPLEVKAGKIKNAINMDISNGDFAKQIEKLDKAKTYFVYCRSGARSSKACSIMTNNGFSHVINLKGGFMSWS